MLPSDHPRSQFLDYLQTRFGIAPQQWDVLEKKASIKRKIATSIAIFDQYVASLGYSTFRPHKDMGYASPKTQRLFCVWTDCIEYVFQLPASAYTPDVKAQLFSYSCRSRGYDITPSELWELTDVDILQQWSCWNVALKSWLSVVYPSTYEFSSSAEAPMSI